jgi:phage baseplate assembly protein W
MATTFPFATLANIQSSSWELMLDSTAGGGAGSGIGQVVQFIADVEQCLNIIFGTIPGEDPFRPTFGCDLTQFLDKPITIAAPAIVAAGMSAIQAWEPRITATSITAALNPAIVGQLLVTISWQPNLGVVNQANQAIGTQTTTIAVGGASSQS